MNVVTLTNLYPSSARPGHGTFVEERMTRFAARFGAHLRVVAPVPWFPFTRGFGGYSRIARTPCEEDRRGARVLHPRVVLVPKVGMTLAPAAWRRACEPCLARLHAERPIDLLDAHYLYPDGVAAVALARRLGVPVVLSARGSDVNVIAKFAGPRADIVAAASGAGAVVAVSRALAERLRALGVPDAKLSVVPNGVEVDRFRSAPRDPAMPAGRALLCVGHLVPGKGFHLAVEALARLRERFDDASLVIAGDGPERGRLEALARRTGVLDRVRFLGEVPHARVPALLRGAARLLLPSFNEGYPNVVVEAVAAGVPVVATRVGGIPEIVDAAVGDLADRPDVDAVAAALERSLQRTFDPAAFAGRAEGMRWDSILDGLKVVFDRAIAEGPPASRAAGSAA